MALLEPQLSEKPLLVFFTAALEVKFLAVSNLREQVRFSLGKVTPIPNLKMILSNTTLVALAQQRELKHD